MVRSMSETIIAMIIIGMFTVVAALGALFLKKGADKLDRNILHQLRNKNLLIGFFLYAAPTPIYIYCLRIANLSIVYAVTSLTYVWVTLFSMQFLKERVNRYKWLGVLCIVLGVSLIAYASA